MYIHIKFISTFSSNILYLADRDWISRLAIITYHLVNVFSKYMVQSGMRRQQSQKSGIFLTSKYSTPVVANRLSSETYSGGCLWCSNFWSASLLSIYQAHTIVSRSNNNVIPNNPNNDDDTGDWTSVF